jgi:hypothetical protein
MKKEKKKKKKEKGKIICEMGGAQEKSPMGSSLSLQQKPRYRVKLYI